MGCCLMASVLAGAPRIALVLWWFFQPVRFNATFTSVFWPILGILFLPWTTLAYVFVFPNGLSVFDWVILVVAFLIDISAYGGGYRSRGQMN